MKHILIVEDEFIISSSLSVYLTGLGYKVTEGITESEEIIDSIKEQKFDLILIEVKLHNGTDGIEIISEIRTFSSIPVIYLTTYITDETLKARAKRTKPVGFLSKPVDFNELRDTVEKCWKS